MEMTFRWYGSDDAVKLEHIRQIPGVTGVVGALFDVPVGEIWPYEKIAFLKDQIERTGLRLSVIESIFVHEDIKLGRPSRDRLIENYCRSIENLGANDISVLCYNFMPVFDWMRTDLAAMLPDGSTTLTFSQNKLDAFDLSAGTGDLPGWGAAYSAKELNALLSAYQKIEPEKLWENLAYFLEKTVPVAAASNVKMAIHPDDPPWSIFGLPRIITSGEALKRLIRIVDYPANGVTFCTGSLGAEPVNDLPQIVREIGGEGRIHFVHARNVKVTGEGDFEESEHPSKHGSVDMYEVMRALHEIGFDGPIRPDHGRMIWGETGRPGYGLHDRALGAMYLTGLLEAIEKSN